MLTKNNERKSKGLTREDSCLKFKMKESVMTGGNSCNSSNSISSPAGSPKLIKKESKAMESRFKKHA